MSSCRCSTRATSSSTAATRTSLDTRRREQAPARARAALRRHGRLRRRGGRAERAEHHAGRLGGVLPDARADLRVDRGRRSTARPAACTSGPDGAGHFVKMVHNGIEYADMQLIAEAYDLLRSGLGATPAEIAEIFRTWNEGELESFLIEITADVLAHADAATGEPFVDIVARPGRAEGHRPLDRAERARPRHPDHRHRRGDLRPVPVRARRAARGRPQATFGSRGRRPAAGRRPGRLHRGRAPARSTPRRSSPTRRASTTSRPAARSTAGTSTGARWPPSGAAAASSGPASSTASARPTTRTRRLPSLLVAPYFADAVAAGVGQLAPGGRRRPPARASRRRRSPRRWPTSTGCAATGCRPR